MRHLLSLADIDQSAFTHLIERGAAMANDQNAQAETLRGKSIGIAFRKTSTRTRTSFTVAAHRLGAHPTAFGPGDLQTNTGESMEDTARVLGGYLHALVLRTAAEQQEIERLARMEAIPIINAMTAEEHPTQALSDFAMLRRHFGSLSGLRLLYVGEGNNTAVALAYAASRVRGMELVCCCPAGYELPKTVIEKSRELGQRFGGRVSELPVSDLRNPGHADVVYATRWQTTGTSKPDASWREAFAPCKVTTALMRKVSGATDAIFMHDLPAVRGEDCEAAVLDGDHSIAFEQARQKLFSAMAVLEWCVSN